MRYPLPVVVSPRAEPFRGDREGRRPDPMIGRRLWFLVLGGWVYDERPVGDGPELDRLFEKTPEEESTKFRPAPIEAEGELIQVPLKMVHLHRSLVGSKQPPL